MEPEKLKFISIYISYYDAMNAFAWRRVLDDSTLLKNEAADHVIEKKKKKHTTITFIGNETALGQQNWPCIFIYSTAERISKLWAYCFILFGSLFENIFIIIFVYKQEDLRKAININYFNVNMAESDLLLLLALLPDQISQLVTDSLHWRVSGI